VLSIVNIIEIHNYLTNKKVRMNVIRQGPPNLIIKYKHVSNFFVKKKISTPFFSRYSGAVNGLTTVILFQWLLEILKKKLFLKKIIIFKFVVKVIRLLEMATIETLCRV